MSPALYPLRDADLSGAGLVDVELLPEHVDLFGRPRMDGRTTCERCSADVHPVRARTRTDHDDPAPGPWWTILWELTPRGELAFPHTVERCTVLRESVRRSLHADLDQADHDDPKDPHR